MSEENRRQFPKGDVDEAICMGDARLIFSCSGAADVGEIADRIGRQLMKARIGKMFCTVGIGAGIEKIIEVTKTAEEVLTIDGCSVACSEKCLKKSGFEPKAVNLGKLGFVKGESPATTENIEKAFSKVADALA
jgi:uncharacterized metal-binding protein